MTRKEKIIYAALELASEYGLKAVSLGQIADKVGIKKPSLYNHFASKDEIISEMYSVLREQAQRQSAISADYTSMFEGNSLETVLTACLSAYMSFLSDKDMLSFFKVLYSERSTSSAAAQIMVEETERMISSTKALFYALVVHGKMKNESVDTAAMSYAMTIHSLVDRQLDIMTANDRPICIPEISEDMKEYINWFCKHMEVAEHE